jgi:ABC-type phosphate transport system substrate-binding protein
MMRSTLMMGSAASAILLATAMAAPAQAAPTKFLYAGGATFPEKAYRDIMNCYGAHSGTDTETGLTSHICNTGEKGFAGPYSVDVQVLYAGVGSGGGRRALRNHLAGDPGGLTNGGRAPDSIPVPSTSDDGPRYGNATGTSWAATKSSTLNPFPSISFIGSDAIITQAEYVQGNVAGNIATSGYLINSLANNWGPMLQVPTLVGAVGIGYNPAAGGNVTWTENGTPPTGPVGAASGVSLTLDTWCGIMTGAITDWNDGEITTDNNGTSITGGASSPIYVVYRSDGSGTTEIFANALINQCASSAHPVPNSWQTSGGNVLGTTNDSFYLNLGPGHANILPVGNTTSGTAGFIGKPGNGGIHDFVVATPGAVGYLSTDFLQPIDSSGPKAINLQSWASVLSGPAVFIQPNATSANAVMKSALPPSFSKGKAKLCTSSGSPTVPNYADPNNYLAGHSPDGICAHNPINWGATSPLPTDIAAFPIGGFTFLELYSCYDPAGVTDLDALVGLGTLPGPKNGYLQWYYGSNSGKVKKSLAKNGFGALPGKWASNVKKLLFKDLKTKVGHPGDASTACSALPASGGA